MKNEKERMEENRIFYVGATRAKKQLLIIKNYFHT